MKIQVGMTNSAQKKKQKKILLTGGRSPCALELARQLHHSGHEVVVADTSPVHVSRFSNAVSKFVVIPSPRFALNAFINSLVKIVHEEKIDLVIPVWEEVLYLSNYLDRFPDSCEVFCSSYEDILTLHNKWSFIKKMGALGFKTPRSVFLHSSEALNNFEFEVPYILKPCYSRGSQNIIKVTTHEVPKITIKKNSPWIAQEFLEGDKYCSYSVCYQGKVLAHTAYPVEYTIGGSSCVAFESIEHPKILDWVKKLVENMNYTGQIAFDFIEVEDGTLYSIDCNPRATSGVHLFKKEDALANAFLHENDQLICSTPGRTQQIATGMLFFGLKDAITEGKFSHYFKKLCTTKDVVFCKRDLSPFICMPYVFVSYFLQSKKLGISMPEYFTYDLEWNEEPESVV